MHGIFQLSSLRYRVWKFGIWISISKFVPNDLIDTNPALVNIMRKTVIWTNADPIRWRIYADLGEGGAMS